MAFTNNTIGNPRFKETDTNGSPLAGGLLYTYAAGTTTPKATYSDTGSLVPNTNPVVLDSLGEATVRGVGAYKFVMKDADGVTLWTVDYVFLANLADTIVADAAAHAASAAASAALALVYETSAGVSASLASASASQALISASAANASAISAAASAAKLSGTSSTSVDIAVGSKAFVTQAGKFFDTGNWVIISSAADPASYMHGQVTAYSGTNLTVNVTNVGGGGTRVDWVIAVSGTRGAAGTGVGDMLKSENLSGLASYPTARTNLGVDTLSRRNRLCNGDFRVDNINAGAAVTVAATGYVVDNGRVVSSQGNKLTAQRVGSPLFPSTKYAELLTVASAVASPGAADAFSFDMPVEGLNFADMMWGAAGGVPITVSFLVYASVSGTYSFSVRSGSADLSYVWTEVLSSATSRLVTKTIPAPSVGAGTWSTTNTVALRLVVDLGSGSNAEATADTWTAGSKFRVAGTEQLIKTGAAYIGISNVQIEKGSFATPFEVLPYQQAEAWCMRYHRKIASGGIFEYPGMGNSTTGAFVPILLKPPMRVAPTGINPSAVAGGVLLTAAQGAQASTNITLFAATVDNVVLSVACAANMVAGNMTLFKADTTTLMFTGAEL